MSKLKKRAGEIDYVLFVTIIILVLVGVVMVWSASSYKCIHSFNNEYYYLIRQARNVTIGIIAMWFAIKIDYRKYKQWSRIIIVVTVVLLILVLIIGSTVNGAKRWISFGGLNIQPSEIAKYSVVILLAKYLEREGENIKKFPVVMKYLTLAGFFAGLVLAEKNLSIFAVIMIVSTIVIFVDGALYRHMAMVIGSGGLLAGLLIKLEPYRMARLLNFSDPWKDAQGAGYQLVQSFYALGSGGLLGVGLGQSRQKAFYIPEPHTDFIFSIIGEELGFIGCAFVIILFCIFIVRGVGIAFKARDTYGTLLAMGITSIIAIQAIINIAVVSGSMPVTGVPLPFISYGGSAVIINLFAMGILLNISKQNKAK